LESFPAVGAAVVLGGLIEGNQNVQVGVGIVSSINRLGTTLLFLDKPLVAERARERLLFGVDPLVLLQGE